MAKLWSHSTPSQGKAPFKWVVVTNPRGMAELETFSNHTHPKETSHACCRGCSLEKHVSEGCLTKAKPERIKTSSELKSWNIPRIQASKVIGNQWVWMLQALLPYLRPGLCILLPTRKEGPLEAALCRKTRDCLHWQEAPEVCYCGMQRCEGGWQNRQGKTLKTC